MISLSNITQYLDFTKTVHSYNIMIKQYLQKKSLIKFYCVIPIKVCQLFFPGLAKILI